MRFLQLEASGGNAEIKLSEADRIFSCGQEAQDACKGRCSASVTTSVKVSVALVSV